VILKNFKKAYRGVQQGADRVPQDNAVADELSPKRLALAVIKILGQSIKKCLQLLGLQRRQKRKTGV
jgi:hypothetical protein